MTRAPRARLRFAPDHRAVLSCEHATNVVPAELAAHFVGAADVLAGHEGWDPGAAELAEDFAAALGVACIDGEVSRLVIEANRTLGHPKLFSRFTRSLDAPAKVALIERYTGRHQARVAAAVRAAGGPVVHLSVHSFTPVWKGAPRDIDIGLLYDPTRAGELRVARAWQAALRAANPELRVRRNRPYLGSADGLTTWLRTEFPADQYLGIELEVSQAFPLGDPQGWRALRTLVVGALTEAL